MSLHENKCDLLFIMWICSFLQTPFEKYFKNQKMSFLRTKYCNSTLDYSCSSIKYYLSLFVRLHGMNWHKMATKFLYADIFWHQNFLYVKFLCTLIFCVSHFCCLYEWPKLSICDTMSQFGSFVVNNLLTFFDNFWPWWQKLTLEVFWWILLLTILVTFDQNWKFMNVKKCHLLTFANKITDIGYKTFI